MITLGKGRRKVSTTLCATREPLRYEGKRCETRAQKNSGANNHFLKITSCYIAFHYSKFCYDHFQTLFNVVFI